jgi:hypothetical protein
LQWWPQIHANESATHPLISHQVGFLLAAAAAAGFVKGGMMSITAHTRTEDDTSAKARLPMLAFDPCYELICP